MSILPSDISPLKMAQEVARIAHEAKSTSLPEYTSSTRLNPVALIDRDLTFMDEQVVANISQTMLSIFCAHYLHAVGLIGSVKNVNTIEILDQLSTDRNVLTGGVLSGYQQKGSILFPDMQSDRLFFYDDAAMVGLEKDVNQDLNAHVNLAVGRLLHVPLGLGDTKVTIPVMATLNPRVINSKDLPAVLAMTEDDTSIVGRYHKWRAGEIESFMDYLFALDLIERDRKALLQDASGIYKDARTRKMKGVVHSLLTGRRSLNQASTMAAITTRTAEELEMELKGPLTRSSVRERYFSATNSMMLMVVDPRKERIRSYTRAIDGHALFTFKDIEKASTSTNGLNINSILEAYKLGEAPTLH